MPPEPKERLGRAPHSRNTSRAMARTCWLPEAEAALTQVEGRSSWDTRPLDSSCDFTPKTAPVLPCNECMDIREGHVSTSSSTLLSRGSGRCGRPPEGKEKGRALLHRALGPNTPPMPLDDALHDRQSHPGAVILVGAVQPLEHPEELVRVAQFISICIWLQLAYTETNAMGAAEREGRRGLPRSGHGVPHDLGNNSIGAQAGGMVEDRRGHHNFVRSGLGYEGH
jgi:hypothetical protein